MRFRSTAKVLAKCMLKFQRISEWEGAAAVAVCTSEDLLQSQQKG